MAESTVAVTPGAGKNLHTNSRTISATVVEDEFVLPGEYPYAGYIISPAAGVTAANAGDDIAQLMAGASLNVRVRRIRIEQVAAITAAATCQFLVQRITSAGTGGTAITPSKMNNAAAAAGATAASGVPTATRGTAGAQLFIRTLFPVQTAPAAGTIAPFWEWVQQPGMEPLIIPAGTTNGISIRNQGARAGLTVNFEIEFVETNFV